MFTGLVPSESTPLVANAAILLSTVLNVAAPLPIDGFVYMWQGNGQDLHRVRNIEGHYNNIHKGKVRVGFWVGDCARGAKADANTGWESVSRIFVEEVLKP